MSTELIINASLPETRIALMEGGEIQELLIERPSGKGIVGNIYKGRVTRVLPGMQAAFVDIGLEKAAFLYVDDVYVHSEIWEEEEGAAREPNPLADEGHPQGGEVHTPTITPVQTADGTPGHSDAANSPEATAAAEQEARDYLEEEDDQEDDQEDDEDESEEEDSDESDDSEGEGDESGDDEEDEDDEPVKMGPGPDDGDSSDSSDSSGGQGAKPPGTIAPPADSHYQPASESQDTSPSTAGAPAAGEASSQQASGQDQDGGLDAQGRPRRRSRRGRRGGRFRNRNREKGEGGPSPVKAAVGAPNSAPVDGGDYPENYQEQVSDVGSMDSDRSAMSSQQLSPESLVEGNRPTAGMEVGGEKQSSSVQGNEFRAQRGRDRRIKPKAAARQVRAQVNIQDLLKEGQEVLVQVAKDPISTKGARLTCHISLPGRHLVCMPTIDHVGVSRRIERDDERRRLREYVERNRPKNLGFIVRTASGKQQSERRIKQDIDYLTRLWSEIREKAAEVTAPALVYEDLNSVLRAIRDWVTEEIDKIIVDSRYHFNDIQRFVAHFMPSLKQKVELYGGDVPIFDAYNISTELSRALERKVWLKSGGYLVIDQAEALVAIDVNTGRYVGKKNLEDTILKTNLEAVLEIAYQLRLRNCGGIIILDLIDMEREENKQRVYRALEEALKKDRARPSILKISELGLVEMTRKRTRDTMVRALCDSCAQCEGKGFIKSKVTVAYEVLRELEREGIERDVTKILVQANPEVIDVLAIDERESLDQLERRYRKQIYLQAVPDFHTEQFEVVGDKNLTGAKENRTDQERDQDRDRDQREGRGGRGGRDRGRGRDRDRGRNDRGGGGRNERSARGPQANPEGGRPQIILRGEPGHVGAGGPHADGAEISQPPVLMEGGVQALDGNGPINGPLSGPVNGTVAMPLRQPGEEFHDEEDRLAFLRAQAAQDAALAKLGGAAAGQAGTQQPRTAGGRDRNDRGRGPASPGAPGGRRGRRGRRGGRDRNDRGPSTGRGPQPLGAAGAPIIPVGGPVGGRGSDEGGSSGNTGGTADSGGGGSDTSGGGSGGPGGHSNPPSV